MRRYQHKTYRHACFYFNFKILATVPRHACFILIMISLYQTEVLNKPPLLKKQTNKLVLYKNKYKDFPGSGQDSPLPLQEAWVQSLDRALRSHMLRGVVKTQNRTLLSGSST